MVRIRLARFGKRNRPFYRIGVFDARTRRDGRTIEYVGFYDPFAAAEAGLKVELERVKHWVSHGAQPSENVGKLLKKAGFPWPPEKKKKKKKKASGKGKKKAAK